MSTRNVHNTHILKMVPQLHQSLIDIASVMNRPERDADLLELAGLKLERALFPLLVLVERLGPIGVVDLAARVGRDYSTVSRQVARLEQLGLVNRQASARDARVREATITAQGKTATDAVDRAREALAIQQFKSWTKQDFDELVRLMRMLADDMSDRQA